MTEEIKQPEEILENIPSLKRSIWFILYIILGVLFILIVSYILYCIFNPKLSRPDSYHIHCKNNLKQIYLLSIMYADDSNYKLNAKDNNLIFFNKLIKHNKGLRCSPLFCCNASKDTPTKSNELSWNNISYIYLGSELLDPKLPLKTIPIFFDYPRNHEMPSGLGIFSSKYYINVVFSDGHVEPFKTEAKTCVEFIDVLHKKFKYSPEILKKLKEKAAQADREQVPHKR